MNKGNIPKAAAGDVFVASVINQKAVNKSAKQVLVAFAIQFFIELEALFGFSTNQDYDIVDS